MLNLTFNSDRPVHALCVGAHCDDIEIGCGGTILRLAREGRLSGVTWVVFSSNEARAAEARRAADFFLEGVGHRQVEVLTFRDGYFPHEWAAVKGAYDAVRQRVRPDVVFTHHKADLHQDHRVLAELTWNLFRDHLIFEYEIPKYDGNPFDPNAYVTLDEQVVRRKVEGLMTTFPTQGSKPWFTPDTFRATLRLRGMECASPTRFAEAFVCRKAVL